MICRKCEEDKQEEDFPPTQGTGKRTVARTCKECRARTKEELAANGSPRLRGRPKVDQIKVVWEFVDGLMACYKCGEEKIENEFPPRQGEGTIRKRLTCKTCTAKRKAITDAAKRDRQRELTGKPRRVKLPKAVPVMREFVDGMMICYKCNENKAENEYPPRQGTGERKKRLACRACYARHQAEYDLRQRETIYAWQKKEREWLIELKSNTPCMDCGVTYPHYVMDFDHMEGHEKHGKISTMISRRKRSTVEDEIAKCELICSNCHRIRTHDRLQEKKADCLVTT